MKYFTIVTLTLSLWLPAGAETHLERAYASLKVAVHDAGSETAIRRNAYHAAVRKAAEAKREADAARAAAAGRVAAAEAQAETMREAITMIAGIGKTARATHEMLRAMGPFPPDSDLSRALAVSASAVDDIRMADDVMQTAYHSAVRRVDLLAKAAEIAGAAADRKAAAAARQAESLKAALSRATDIQNKTQAALESVELALEAFPLPSSQRAGALAFSR